jgi:hypothetical protein
LQACTTTPVATVPTTRALMDFLLSIIIVLKVTDFVF